MEELQKYQQQLGKQQSEFGELKHQFTGLSINGGPNGKSCQYFNCFKIYKF